MWTRVYPPGFIADAVSDRSGRSFGRLSARRPVPRKWEDPRMVIEAELAWALSWTHRRPDSTLLRQDASCRYQLLHSPIPAQAHPSAPPQPPLRAGAARRHVRPSVTANQASHHYRDNEGPETTPAPIPSPSAAASFRWQSAGLKRVTSPRSGGLVAVVDAPARRTARMAR